MMSGSIGRRRFLGAAPMAAVLSDCSLLSNPSAAQIYRLSPHIDDPDGVSIAHARLTIDLPFASRSLDTDRIALTLSSTRFDYFDDSVWMDRLPVLVQSLMVNAFEADGRISEVSRNQGGLDDGYLLRTEIRQFEAHYADEANGPPEVAVELKFQLSRGRDERPVGRKLVSARARASRNKLDAVVGAFDIATGEALSRGVAWTMRAMSRR